MPTLEEARKTIAELDAAIVLIYEKHKHDGDGPMFSEDEELDDADELRNKIARRRSLMCEYASDAALRLHMWCWMVDVNGRESNIASEEQLYEGLEMLQTNVPEDEVLGRFGGALMQNVNNFISSMKLRITDKGGGVGGWHLGTPCNQAEMESLTTSLHAKFKKAIAAEMLMVQVKFWGWRFKSE